MHCKAHFLPTLLSAWEICTEWAASENISLFEEVLSVYCSLHLFKWQNLHVAQAGVELGNYVAENSLELMFLPLPPSAGIAPGHLSSSTVLGALSGPRRACRWKTRTALSFAVSLYLASPLKSFIIQALERQMLRTHWQSA